MISPEPKFRTSKKSRWSNWFIAISIFQLITALVLLIPFLVNIRKIHYMISSDASTSTISYSYEKAFRVSGEGFMFLAFEVWRLLLSIDGVMHFNSRTIYATALFTLASFSFSILMIVESVNWINYTTETFHVVDPLFQELQKINQNLLIALGCIVFLTILPTYIVTRKLTKDFGWDIYKKIGSSIRIQRMYIDVQWFSLMLKIDIYFEFMSYTLWFGYLAGSIENWTGKSSDTPILYILLLFMVLLIPSYVMARIAISREIHLLVVIFVFSQILFFVCTIILMVHYSVLVQIWYAFTGYCLGNIIAAIATIILAINCQLNFNKGVKEFVQWNNPFSEKLPRRQSAEYSNMSQTDSFYGLTAKIDMPIDDE